MEIPHLNKILVVSLARATERRSKILDQFAANNITNFEIIEAVDGRNIDRDRMFTDGLVCESQYIKRRLAQGEIACVLSHRKAWERVIEKYDNALICEDDIVFREDSLRTLINAMHNVPSDWDILYMWSYLVRNRQIFNNNWQIARFEYGGAMCYAITKKVALYLRAISNQIDNVLDKITAKVTQDGSPFKGYICRNVFDHDNEAHSYIGELGRDQLVDII